MVGTGGWQNYKSFPVEDAYGNEVVIPISGKKTFRFTQSAGGCNFNYVMLMPATGTGTLTPYLAKALPAVDAANVSPLPLIQATIGNRDTTVTVNTVKLLLNGSDITSAATITGEAYGVVVSCQLSALLPASSTNTVAVVFSDSANTSITNTWQFVVGASYPVLNAATVVPASQINLNNRGFNIYNNQISIGRPGPDANMLPAPLNQLWNLILDPATGLPYDNLSTLANGLFTETGTINYNKDSTDANPTGGNAAPFGPNKPNPGIPGTTGSVENYINEATTWLELKQGSHTFSVNSDDGFLVTSGADGRDALLPVIGIANFGKGNSEEKFTFIAPVDGIYSFSILYFRILHYRISVKNLNRYVSKLWNLAK
jgi:hypothetical protein